MNYSMLHYVLHNGICPSKVEVELNDLNKSTCQLRQPRCTPQMPRRRRMRWRNTSTSPPSTPPPSGCVCLPQFYSAGPTSKCYSHPRSTISAIRKHLAPLPRSFLVSSVSDPFVHITYVYSTWLVPLFEINFLEDKSTHHELTNWNTLFVTSCWLFSATLP